MIDNTVIQMQDVISSLSRDGSVTNHETVELIAHAQSLIKDVTATRNVYDMLLFYAIICQFTIIMPSFQFHLKTLRKCINESLLLKVFSEQFRHTLSDIFSVIYL